MFNNKTIFVSGGTGSFGNKFIEVITKNYKPKKIIVYSRDEYKQYLMEKKFSPNKYPFMRFFLGDVRDKESFSKGTIGNAIHLDRGLLEFYLAEGSPLENDMFKNNPDKEYVVFCGVGGQGTLATKTMKDMGVKNVKNITGGMKEWEKIK